MKPSLLLLFLLFAAFFITHSKSNEESFISFIISQKGLTFTKDLLIKQAISSLETLQLPKINQSVEIPVLGDVQIALSNIRIDGLDVPFSYVKPGQQGVAIVASGAKADLSMDWCYSYTSLFGEISDNGVASVQVTGMEVGLTLGLDIQQGTLELSLVECSCLMKDMSIDLDGGASWLYRGLVDAFEGKIRSAVENAITEKIKEGIVKLNSSLQTLPKEIPVDEVAALNNTFVNTPLLSGSSIGFEINGLFTEANKSIVPHYYLKSLQPLVSCEDPEKMLEISLDEAVFNSGSAVYFNAGALQWIVDKAPVQSLLKTSAWKYIIPQLYNKYPNNDMNLNVSLSSPPVIQISSPSNIDITFHSDITIDVLDASETIPVACFSVVSSASGSVKIRGNNLAGNIKLNDFALSLKWSKIGNFHMYLIQTVMGTILRTIAFQYANARLIKGFPLPIIKGFTLQNAKVFCTNSRIIVCSDIKSTKSYTIKKLPIYRSASVIAFSGEADV